MLSVTGAARPERKPRLNFLVSSWAVPRHLSSAPGGWSRRQPPMEAARDCFKGLGTNATVKVVLGDQTPTGKNASLPSCREIDGLNAGTALTPTISQGPRPQNSGGDCYRYDTSSIDGADGVSVSPPSSI